MARRVAVKPARHAPGADARSPGYRMARRLLDGCGMTKTLVSSALCLALLCAPALAAPPAAPSPPAPPATALQNVRLKLAVSSGKDVRSYSLDLIDRVCGDVENKSSTLHDEIRACMHADGAAMRLDLEWNLRDHDRELKNKSTVIARPGDQVELYNAGARLTVAIQ